MTAFRKLLLSALLMTAFLIGMTLHHAHRRASGTEIRLDMTPVDPRDPWMGYYSRIATPLARLDLAELASDGDFYVNDTVYVSLEPRDDGSATAQAVTIEKPDDGLFVRGQVQEVYDPAFPGEEGVRHARLTVHYNIERYYASAEDARALDQRLADAGPDGTGLRLILSISDDGHALIKGIEIDGDARYDRLW